MAKSAKKRTELIGNAPLLELSKIEKINNVDFLYFMGGGHSA
jgi:hypothetical protein